MNGHMTTSPPNTSTLQQTQMTMPQGNIDFGTKFTCTFSLKFGFHNSTLSSVCFITDIFLLATQYNVPQQYTQNPSVLPYMPLLMVPHNDSMGPINYNAVPSVDRTGADLPHNGNNTSLNNPVFPIMKFIQICQISQVKDHLVK